MLNVINREIVAQTLTRCKLRVIEFRVELVNRNTYVLLVWWHKQVEVEGIVYCGLDDCHQRFSVNLLCAECHWAHQRLTLTFHPEALLTIYEDATYKVTLIGITVVLLRVG